MARVVVEENQVVRPEWQIWLRVVAFGVAVGLLYWLAALLIGRYIVEPLTCREVVSAAACTDASVLAGKISTILVAVAAVFAMIRFGVARPLIVALASAVVLWSLSAWTAGLWWLESLSWSVVLYALAYGLFGWVARHGSVVIASVLALVLAVAISITLALI